MINLQLGDRSRRVLVVEDNSDAADSLAILLRLAGHQVQTAYDGPEALKIADEQQPEVVLLDIGLPHMDGYEIARQLRKRPHNRHMVIIAVTGHGSECDVEQSLEAGLDLHLVKPVDPSRLLGLLSMELEELLCSRT